MKKNIFLTGASGCGKTSMIRNMLGNKLSFAGGFITERAYSESGRFLGYDLLPAAAASGVGDFEGLRFLDYSRTPPKADNEVFRSMGLRLLQEAEYYPYVMLDEFGGFELLIPQFREAVLDILNSDIPCVGVLKCMPNGEQLRCSLGLGEKYTVYLETLTEALKKDGDTLLITVSGADDEYIRQQLSLWTENYCQ